MPATWAIVAADRASSAAAWRDSTVAAALAASAAAASASAAAPVMRPSTRSTRVVSSPTLGSFVGNSSAAVVSGESNVVGPDVISTSTGVPSIAPWTMNVYAPASVGRTGAT
jgi:hypothetical protein